MTAAERRALQQAIERRETVKVVYAKPASSAKTAKARASGESRLVTRFVRPYEMSVNKSGRPVLWGTDSIHGARQIHGFRVDRIQAVVPSERPKEFRPAKSITKHLDSFDDD